MKINKTLNLQPIVNGAFIAAIGVIIGITICPQKDYTSCLDLAEQDKLIVSQDGVITDLAIQTINGSNYSYNKSLSKCLELAK